MIDGARAVLLRVKYNTRGFGQWVHRLAQRFSEGIATAAAKTAAAGAAAVAATRVATATPS